MKAQFLDLVLREAAVAAAGNGEGPLSDADLLGRFVAGQDHAAFAVLVKRHARLVWAVCRQVTAAPGDAEDAFQAVWLALVRQAGTIRNVNALTAWLHGTAYRISAKANQTAGRRRIREEIVAPAEATRPVSDATWSTLLSVVHEEIARLPAGLRTAFVICELEGVPPGTAAVRLGWKPGTLTGRLCQARQTLMTQLTRRGLAPAAALAGCGIGSVTSGATVPSALLAGAASLPAASAVIPATIYELAKAATEGTMTKMKLLAAGILISSALGLGGAAGVFAQRPGMENQPQPNAGRASSGAASPAQNQNPGGGLRGVAGRASVAGNPWEYKVETMPADRMSLMTLLRTRGEEGWEYCGTATFGGPRVVGAGGGERLNLGEGVGAGTALTFLDTVGARSEGISTDLIFKRPRPVAARSTSTTSGESNPFRGTPGGTPAGVTGTTTLGEPMPGSTNRLNPVGPNAVSGNPEGQPTNKGSFNPLSLVDNSADVGRGAATVPADGDVVIKVVKLKRAKVADAARIAEQLFANQLTVAVDEPTNNLILKGSPPVVDSVLAILTRLDESARTDEGGGSSNPAGRKP